MTLTEAALSFMVPPPGELTGGVPLLGDLPAFVHDPLAFVLEAAERRPAPVRIDLPGRRAYLLTEPSEIQFVLRDGYKRFSKMTPVYRAMATILGEGILTSEGDSWLRHRRMIQPAFHKRRVEAFGGSMVRAVQALSARWEPLARRGATIDVAAEMTRLTLHIVTETLLGSKALDDADEVGRTMDVLQRYANGAIRRLWPVPLWVPTRENRAHARALRAIDALTYGLIDARRVGRGRDSEPGEAVRTDLLSILVDARDDDGAPLSRRQLRDELITFIAAGHDTTANTLSWTMWLLSLHPEVARRLLDELDEALGVDAPSVADLDRLPYTRAVIDEALRLYPPAWITARIAREPVSFGVQRVAAGDLVFVSPWVMHRRPALWRDPEAFDPARWLEPEASRASRPAFAYLPFGGGAHKCIGERFALQEAALALAVLARRFVLEALPGVRVQPEPLITMSPRGGLPMRLGLRPPSARAAA